MVRALRWVFCVDLRTDADFCLVYHWLIDFYNRGGKLFTARYGLIPYTRVVPKVMSNNFL